jgi:uncharacterized protein with beta-barrel porin domain
VTLEASGVTNGAYEFLTSDAALPAGSLNSWSLTPLNINRVAGNIILSADLKSLLVETKVANMRLTYQGGTVNVWDYVSKNWSGSESFVYGDQASFLGLGQGSLIVNEIINAGKITFANGNYELTGSGTLRGILSQGLSDSDGSLTLNSGSLKFSNTGGGYFEGDVNVIGGELILNSELTTLGDFVLGAGSKLSFEGVVMDYVPFVGYLRANNIDIFGILEANLTDLTGVAYDEPFVIKVGEATGNLNLNTTELSGALALYDYSFGKSGGDLTLTVTPKDSSSLGGALLEISKGSKGGGPMMESIVKALEKGTTITGTLETSILDILNSETEALARERISNMSGGVLAQSVDIGISAITDSRSRVSGVFGYEPMYVNYAAPASGSSPQDSWTVQAAVTGSWGSGDRMDYEPGYDLSNYSAMLALYHRSESIRMGGAISLGKTEADWDNGANAETKDISGTLFVRYDYFDWFISVEGSIGVSSASSVRYPGAGTEASADYDIDWSGASFRVGRLFEVGTWRVTPRLGGVFTHINFPGFVEKGAGTLNLTAAKDTIKSFELESGVLIAKEIDFNSSYLTPRINLGVAVETQDESTRLITYFAEQAGIPSFVTDAADMGRIRGMAALGADYALSDFANFSIDYKGSFKENERTHSASLGLNFSW